MDNKFKVVFTGKLAPGAEFEAVAQAFAAAFHVTGDKARALLQRGKPAVLKKDLSQERAQAFRDALRRLGMEVRAEPMPPAAPDNLSLVPMEEEGQAEPEKAAAPTCPKCGSEYLDQENDTCLDCGVIISKYRRIMESRGIPAEREPPPPRPSTPRASTRRDNPYAAPTARLDEPPEESAMTGPYALGIGHGWHWIKEGFDLFRKNPGGWIGALVVMVVIAIGVSFIPFLGGLAINLLSPVFMGGFMLGADEQRQGGDFRVSHLFAGFSGKAGPLLLLGLLYLLATLGAALAIGSVMFAQMGGLEVIQGLQQGDPQAFTPEDIDPTGMLPMVLLIVALMIPVMMAYWFAPALIAVEGLSVFAALGQSFVACMKNVLPFLWYGILAAVLMFLGVLPLGLGLLVVLPMLTASIYAGYREIFYR